MEYEMPMQESTDPLAGGSGIVRDAPMPEHSTAALVGAWQDKLLRAKKHWDKTFAAMKWGQRFVKGKQWPDQGPDDERYVANIVQRHVTQRTAALYAKNPKFYFDRRRQLDFAVWDGTQKMLQEAMASMQTAAQPVADPMMMLQQQQMMQQAQALLADVMSGMQRKQMSARIGKTLEVLAEYELSEQRPPFKKQMKQLIRRTLACKVGYVKLGFEREMQLRPEDQEKVRDYTQQLARLEQLLADKADGEMRDCDAEMAELRQLLESAQSGEQVIVREGLVIDYPQAHRVIPDPGMTQLQGFLGCGWVAHEFSLHTDIIKQVYGIDLKTAKRGGQGATGMTANRNWAFGSQQDGDTKPDEVLVWEVQDKTTGMVFTIAEGHSDYLRAPALPDVKLERFWTLFPLTFNDAEDEDDPFPQSDAEMLRHIQVERNRSREGLREHRIAARPATVTKRGALSDEDKKNLMAHDPMAVIELDGLDAEDDVGKVLQNLQKPGIDPNLYVTTHLEQDMQMVSGSQEANLGGVSGGTATESSIAESSRMTAVGSNIDDLDDFLTEVAHSIGHILLSNMTGATVTEIVGPGAVWPEFSREEIVRDLVLTTQAGSSGRPNKAADIANFERLAPTLLQIPGISPEFLAKHSIRLLDDKVDLEEAIIAGLPPITAMAAMMGSQVTPQGGGATVGADGSQNPVAQGDAGAQNAPATPGSESNTSAQNPGAGPSIQSVMAGM